jgi:hypothetical protein
MCREAKPFEAFCRESRTPTGRGTYCRACRSAQRGTPPRTTLAERFWAKVDRAGPVHPALNSRCLLWTGVVDQRGYGSIGDQGRNPRAHRVAWQLTHGPIPAGEHYGTTCVCHRCDNPSCANPDHLFLRTQADNSADMVAKGRAGYQRDPEGWSRACKLPPVRGERNPNSKLTAEAVREIRAKHATGEKSGMLAREYGVSRDTIGLVVRRKLWTWVDA